MALSRKYQKVFGKNAVIEDMGVVGSKNAGNPQNSKDVETIQSLSNWETGLRAQVNSSDAPYLQDQNSIFYVITSQLAYLFQSGIAEWNSQTEYIANRSVVLRSGKVYVALANSTNVEPEVTSGWASYWKSLDVSWGGILGNLKNQTDLFNVLLKGLSYDNNVIYSKGDRVLTYFNGCQIYIDSTKNNNTDEPNDTNIYFLKNVKEAEWVITNDNPLPEASASQVGKIYFIHPNMPTTSFSTCYVGVDGGGGSYTWAQRYISTATDDAEIVFLKQTKTYFKRNNSTTYSPLGESYSWICNEYFTNAFPSNIYVALTLGASNSEYVAPADGWFNIRVKTTNTGQYLLVTCKDDNDNEIYNMEINSGYTGNNLALLAPVSKGQKIKVSYNSSSSEKSLKFIYAQKGE